MLYAVVTGVLRQSEEQPIVASFTDGPFGHKNVRIRYLFGFQKRSFSQVNEEILNTDVVLLKTMQRFVACWTKLDDVEPVQLAQSVQDEVLLWCFIDSFSEPSRVHVHDLIFELWAFKCRFPGAVEPRGALSTRQTILGTLGLGFYVAGNGQFRLACLVGCQAEALCRILSVTCRFRKLKVAVLHRGINDLSRIKELGVKELVSF